MKALFSLGMSCFRHFFTMNTLANRVVWWSQFSVTTFFFSTLLFYGLTLMILESACLRLLSDWLLISTSSLWYTPEIRVLPNLPLKEEKNAFVSAHGFDHCNNLDSEAWGWWRIAVASFQSVNISMGSRLP